MELCTCSRFPGHLYEAGQQCKIGRKTKVWHDGDLNSLSTAGKDTSLHHTLDFANHLCPYMYHTTLVCCQPRRLLQ